MRKILLLGLVVAVVMVFSLVHVETCPAKVRYVTIGTGGVTGIYYPTGGAIGKIVNKKRKQYNLRVTVESTGGSVFNVNAVMAGDLEFGLIQSDRQYQAWNGLKDWKDKGPQKKLRAICSFHPESVTLVAADDSGIESFMDLRGKHVNIGNPGSGQRGNSTDAFEACGIDWRTDLRAEGLKADESAKFLQDGRIDAFFYTVGHPNGSIKEATSGRRKVHIVPVTGPCIDKLVAKWPYYAKAYVPMTFYPMASNKEDPVTFAVKTTFCTSADIPDDIVYAITKEVFDNLEDFKKLHPAYGILTKQSMLEALTAPIHPGAMKYYKEVGLK
jgi:TRAP transporter TAXI family solute receptor